MCFICWPVCLAHIQFSSVAQSCPTLYDPMNLSTPGLPVHHQLPESTQTYSVFIVNQQNHSHTSSYSMLWHMPFATKLSPFPQNQYNSASWGTIFLFLGRKLFLWVVWAILKEKQQSTWHTITTEFMQNLWGTRAPGWQICKSDLQVSLGCLTTSIGWLRCGLKRGNGVLRFLGPGPF